MNKTLNTEQDADQLFRAFFQHEAPHPWPTFRPPVRRTGLPSPAAPRRRRFVLGSKLALAAAVALLTLCGWLLSGAFDSPARDSGGLPHLTKLEAEKDKGKHEDAVGNDVFGNGNVRQD